MFFSFFLEIADAAERSGNAAADAAERDWKFAADCRRTLSQILPPNAIENLLPTPKTVLAAAEHD